MALMIAYSPPVELVFLRAGKELVYLYKGGPCGIRQTLPILHVWLGNLGGMSHMSNR